MQLCLHLTMLVMFCSTYLPTHVHTLQGGILMNGSGDNSVAYTARDERKEVHRETGPTHSQMSCSILTRNRISYNHLQMRSTPLAIGLISPPSGTYASLAACEANDKTSDVRPILFFPFPF